MSVYTVGPVFFKCSSGISINIPQFPERLHVACRTHFVLTAPIHLAWLVERRRANNNGRSYHSTTTVFCAAPTSGSHHTGSLLRFSSLTAYFQKENMPCNFQVSMSCSRHQKLPFKSPVKWKKSTLELPPLPGSNLLAIADEEGNEWQDWSEESLWKRLCDCLCSSFNKKFIDRDKVQLRNWHCVLIAQKPQEETQEIALC